MYSLLCINYSRKAISAYKSEGRDVSMEKGQMGLYDYFQIIRKRIWLIVLITALSTGISAILSYNFLVPIYQAKTDLLINRSYPTNEKQPTATIPLGDVDVNLKLVETYKDITLNPRVIEQVYSKIGDSIVLWNNPGYFMQNQKDPIEKLTQMINVEVSEKSQVISILVNHPDPKQAALIADTVAKTFQGEVKALINVENVQIMTNARVSTIPVSPIPWLNISIAFALGLMISIILVFLLKRPK